MRTIKFRGKKEFTNEWLVGSLLSVADEHFIFPEEAPHSYNTYRVNSETVGQFTGLLDKDGNEIYEGDILHLKWNDYDKDFGYVKWHNNGYFYVDDYFGKFPKNTASPIGDFFCRIKKDFEGIELSINGNIHDNPELIEKGEISYVL